ncbi:ATP-binding cassette domain-containing protein, partial [Escherichia coli]
MMVKKTTLLTVNNVSKSVQPTGKEKRLVLNEINLRLYDNEVVSILGQSGSGKSTLLRMLSGLIAPDLGTVMLGDKKVSGPNPQINMVFQTFAIFPWLNVYQNIAFGLQAQDL